MIRRTAPLRRTRLKPKPKKNPIPEGRREEIFERDDGKCRSCGVIVFFTGAYAGHVHHIIFKSHGVDHSHENLILLCDYCHARVHHTTQESLWLWIVGDATTAIFTTSNPKKAQEPS